MGRHAGRGDTAPLHLGVLMNWRNDVDWTVASVGACCKSQFNMVFSFQYDVSPEETTLYSPGVRKGLTEAPESRPCRAEKWWDT